MLKKVMEGGAGFPIGLTCFVLLRRGGKERDKYLDLADTPVCQLANEMRGGKGREGEGVWARLYRCL